MGRWQPLTIPLISGHDESTAQTDARAVGLVSAYNVDFGKRGGVRGRPGYMRRALYHQTTYVPSSNTSVPDGAAVVPSSLTTTARPYALVRHRDENGERPLTIGTGRTWTFEETSLEWKDKLYGAPWATERLFEAVIGLRGTNLASYRRLAGGYSYIPTGNVIGNGTWDSKSTRILNSEGSLLQNAFSYSLSGGSARCGIYDCVFGHDGNTSIRLAVRTGTGTTVTDYNLTGSLSGGTIYTPTLGGADNPALCCDYDQTVLFAATKVVPGTQTLNLYRINPATGAVLTTQVLNVANINSFWITNTDVATNRLVLCYTRSGIAGLFTKIYNATTLADMGLDLTFNPAGFAGDQCVCGVAESGEVWLAYRENNGAAEKNIIIGKRDLGSAAGFVMRKLCGYFITGTTGEPQWYLAHQPVKVKGRVLMGIQHWGHARFLAGTWFACDLTDMHRTPSPGTTGQVAGTANFGIAAMCPDYEATEFFGPSSAILGTDGESYRFASYRYTDYIASGGWTAALGLNEVRLAAPQADSFGSYTVIGGSVPHLIGAGTGYELGFLCAPVCALTEVAGVGPFTAGNSYTAAAVWKHTDESGVVTRSAPSNLATVNVIIGAQLRISANYPQLTERLQSGHIEVELYLSEANPPAGAPLYLQAVVPLHGTGGALQLNSTTLMATPVVAASTLTTFSPGFIGTLYTTGGVFANLPVSADGGVATLGRRIWVSDGRKVYASKLARDGFAPAFNSEGALAIEIPSTAGRVRALQALDDKLIILCERGIYYTQGQGPDDAGLPPDFLEPVCLSKMGVKSTRLCAAVKDGVVFMSHESGAVRYSGASDGSVGGLYFIDRGLNLRQVSGPVENSYLNATDMVYNPERELLYLASGSIIPTWDLRADLWSIWEHPEGDTVTSLACINGRLWVQTSTQAGVYSGSRLNDFLTGLSPITMRLKTKHLYANGSDGLGWSRVRNVRLLGEGEYVNGGAVSATVALDQIGGPGQAISVTADLVQDLWPRGRFAPEIRLPVQKCSSIQVEWSVDATDDLVLTAISLDIQPIGRVPSARA